MDKRRRFKPEEKARIVLELMSGERTPVEIAAAYGVHPTQIHRWKAEAIENMPSLFTRGANEVEKMRKEHEVEKDELVKQIGKLTIEVEWLKKKSQEIGLLRKKT